MFSSQAKGIDANPSILYPFMQVRPGKIRAGAWDGLERGSKEGLLSRHQGERDSNSRISVANRLLRLGGMSLNQQKCLTSHVTGSYGIT